MLKSLIAVGMALTLTTQPPQNTNDGTYYQDVNITETYEYETNEVNSVDDLVVGNIYKIDFDLSTYNSNENILRTNTYIKININEYLITKLFSSEHEMNFYLRPTNNAIILVDNINGDWLITLSNVNFTQNLSIYFIYTSNQYLNSNNLPYASDYLGEKTITVEPVETEGLYNLAYHFLYSRIYTNTELQGMETTLFGTTINVNMWLAHTTAIVIICLLLVVLIKFVLWLFKIVSGGMLWK